MASSSRRTGGTRASGPRRAGRNYHIIADPAAMRDLKSEAADREVTLGRYLGTILEGEARRVAARRKRRTR
jgi:hypothetical protein